MKLLIDNLDGLGAVDYGAAVDSTSAGIGAGTAHAGVKIERALNKPSLAAGVLCLVGSGLGVPVRRARVTIVSDAGMTLFTGYLTTEPVAIYAGAASEGSVYRMSWSAVSDEWLLDKQASGSGAGVALADFGGTVLKTLVNRLDGARLLTGGVQDGRQVGVFEPEAGSVWSGHAGAVADATYTAYRALGGALSLQPMGSVLHALSEGDGTLQVAGLRSGTARELANDVTLSGEMEPTTYWTEIFTGDGTTAAFELTGEATAPDAGRRALLADEFHGSGFDRQRWSVTDPGSHLTLGVNGLTLSGGNGLDGQTVLQANDALELGGSNVVELREVVLLAASAGVVAGLYAGAAMEANCVAGFHVRQLNGQTVMVPLVNGVEVGGASAVFTLLDGHRYTLRIRLHCAEMLRVRQTYYAFVESAGAGTQVAQFGGGLVDAPLSLVFEVRDSGSSSNTPTTVLYDGVLTSSPAKVNVVAVNSLQLFGSVGSIHVTRTGSAWVRSTDAQTGTPRTRLIGRAGAGEDCSVSSSVTGKVTFYAGRVPAPGEIVTVRYRGRLRAVARVADLASLGVEGARGSVGTARWAGHVARPAARSSEDCEFAARAMLSFSSNRSAAVAGTYAAINPQSGEGDFWPGDVLALTANGSGVHAIVRRVTVEERGASPEALLYKMEFANDWAEGLGLQVSEVIAKDVLLPGTALSLGAGTTPGTAAVLASLGGLSVTAVTGTGTAAALTVDAGTAPPMGGGFEVRRRDGGFGSGLSGTGGGELVLRSPVRGFSIPRSAVGELFFVRMYDGSTPPLYSRWSSAIVSHCPVG